MTIVELRDRVIDEGIISVLTTETGAKRAGALRGFERCRDLYTPDQFRHAITEDERELQIMRELSTRGTIDLDAYWERRYEQMQIEHVFKVLRVAWNIPPLYASAILQYAHIVGVREGVS